MRFLERVRMAMRMLFGRGGESARLNAELEFHIEQQVSENVAHGMGPAAARAAAMRSFGNPGLVREQARATWSWNWLETVGRDVRFAVRTLARSPGFSVIAILVMALGIGAATALFTVVSAVLLKPLPFRDPQDLVMVYEHFRSTPGDSANVVAPGDYRDWRAQTHGFADMAAYRDYGADLTGEHGEMPEVAQAGAATANFLSVLGVQPALGRWFTDGEDQPNGVHAVVLTWSLYQRRFAGNPAIVGKQVRIDSEPFTVVGVLPATFTYPDQHIQLWMPYGFTFTPLRYDSHESHQSYVVARLRKGVSVETAIQQVSAVQYQLHLANASRPVTEEATYRPMVADLTRDVSKPLYILLGAVLCMLLIACLNVSNLLVARSAARRKEVAVRGALGGSRWALIREQMTETMLIAFAGGALGLALSLVATRWLATHWQDLPRAEDIHVDGAVLAFSVGLTVVAALLSGLLPAISSTGKGVLAALQDSSRSIGGSASRATLRRTLLTAEIALTVTLLVCAGLLFKSFLHLRTTDIGCITDHMLTLRYGLPVKQYDTREKVAGFHEALLERVRALPGVKAAGLVSIAPGSGWHDDEVFTISERPAPTDTLQYDALIRSADPGYFSAVGIPLVSGRWFTSTERLTRDHFVVVSRKFATQYLAGDDAVGKHLNFMMKGQPESFEIIGVVGDTLYSVSDTVNGRSGTVGDKAAVYFPILRGLPDDDSDATLMVHTSVDPLSLSMPIQKQIAALDPALPTYDVLTMPQLIGKSTTSESFSATLVLAFAVLSLVLAAIGLYGVLSYLVTQRITEIGIRMALGAQKSQVLSLVLIDGLRPVFVGLVIGLAGGAGAGALIRSTLYGTSPLDPLVFATMVGALLLTAVAACAVPAIRASRVDPMQALRTE